ncbi:helix-turn-helix domain-containing protein [Streptomyces sp. Li-HN-5-11]|uniref:PucR family transcriptional regulator n=1 Tax=Streptomyces sp. Li-HN-5-11 TaxID=3075432 RepID=UPI0028A7229F|nr:helix-turn-helix domain-containing protein [Streptomyces sp. Li-HN-5-11]WNM31727.1 helix-turn-helix domain-containing protein [Streptomyces sp. Li-HN-5-11]
MTEPHVAEGVRGTVQEVAVALLPELPGIGAEATDHICDQVPDIVRAGARDVVLVTCQAHAAIFLDHLIRGVPLASYAPTPEIRELTRTAARRGLPLTAVVRGYRVGAHYLIARWTDAVAEHGPGDRSALEAVKAGTSFILLWLEMIIEQLTAEYRDEDERLARERSLARVELVRQVLGEPDTDIAAASERLGYRLKGRHIALALRARTDKPDAGASLEGAVRELARAMRATSHLAARVDMRTVWCWMACGDSSPPRLGRTGLPVLTAAGRPGVGLDGFRRSHREALDALRIAELAGRDGGTVTYYDEVGVAALCSADFDKCAEFVRTELGALCGAGPVAGRHRETLLAFYGANSNYRATAAELGLHHNTVRYRLDQAERALGHGPAERRLSLELALHLHSLLGDSIDQHPAQ